MPKSPLCGDEAAGATHSHRRRASMLAFDAERRTRLRRHLMRSTISLLASLAAASAAHAGALPPTSLRCEHLVNPPGIDVREPRLGWELQSNERAQKQTAYHLLVASTADNLKADRGDLWDSGEVK